MHSKLLESKGLSNLIGGSEYDISFERKGVEVLTYVDEILQNMKASPESIYYGKQAHGDNIEYCDGIRGIDYPLGKIFDDTDGLITDKPNIALVIKFADCTPVLLFDPVKKVQCCVHSGWRGTVKRISQRAIEKMCDEFHCKRENIHAFLGPDIDVENYEVGTEVYHAFSKFKNRDKFFIPYGQKYKLDMTLANLDILLGAGIKEENIEISPFSTFLEPRLNSARRQKEEYRLNCIISIIP
ncbi:MAG: peptidoglycan editing factor PgeF [Peptoniphilus sp.]|nr:peptidoglycan editing factor PgeF [Peptoniphilus sp.]